MTSPIGVGMNHIETVRPRWAFTLLALLLAGALTAQSTQAQTLGLEEAVRAALGNNRDVLAARLGLEEAREQVSEAWSNVYPTVDFNASYTRNVSPTVNFLPAAIFDPTAGPDDYIGVRFGADNQWTSSIIVEQPLFRPSIFVALGAAGRFRNLMEESVRGQTQSVVTRVRVAYYQLLLAQEQVRLTDNSVNRVRQSLAETRALNRTGIASEYDVLRLEVELANLEPNLRRAQNTALQAKRQIAVELDVADQESIEVRGSLAEMNLDDLMRTRQITARSSPSWAAQRRSPSPRMRRWAPRSNCARTLGSSVLTRSCGTRRCAWNRFSTFLRSRCLGTTSSMLRTMAARVSSDGETGSELTRAWSAFGSASRFSRASDATRVSTKNGRC